MQHRLFQPRPSPSGHLSPAPFGWEGRMQRSTPLFPGPEDICTVHWTLPPSRNPHTGAWSTIVHGTWWAEHPVKGKLLGNRETPHRRPRDPRTVQGLHLAAVGCFEALFPIRTPGNEGFPDIGCPLFQSLLRPVGHFTLPVRFARGPCRAQPSHRPRASLPEQSRCMGP